MWFVNICKKLGNVLPAKDLKYSEEFKESLQILRWDVSPEEVIVTSRVLMIITFFLFLVLALVMFVLNLPFIYPLIGMVIVPVLVAHLVTEYPKNEAKLEIIKALGESPRTLAYIVILLKQNPNLEEAIRFSAEFSYGRIASDFKDALWKVWSGKATNVKSLLPGIAEKWGKYSTDFKRAMYSIISGLSEKSETTRNLTLDRALKTALDGIVFKTRNFVNSLYVPTMVLFSFGTVVPLMFISLLPVVSIFGIDIVNAWSVGLFLLLTGLLLYVYSNRILIKRPATFSPPEIPNLPGFPKEDELLIFGRRIPAYVVLTTIFVLVGFPGFLFLFQEAGLVHLILDRRVSNYLSLFLVWAVGLAITVYCYGKTHFKKKILKRMKELESEIVEVMYTLANRLMEGRPPEDAIYFIHKTFPNTELGKMMKIAYDNIKKRNVTLEDSLFNSSFGALKGVYSKTVLSLFKLFVSSAKKGHKTASQMLMVIATNFDELGKVERELQNMLAKSMAMLKMTVIFIGPVIAGVAIALYDVLTTNLTVSQKQMMSIGSTGFFGNFFFAKPPSLSVGMLALLVGLYLVGITLILTRYIVVIEQGPSKDRVMESTYKVLPLSLIIFTLSIIFTINLVGGL